MNSSDGACAIRATMRRAAEANKYRILYDRCECDLSSAFLKALFCILTLHGHSHSRGVRSPPSAPQTGALLGCPLARSRGRLPSARSSHPPLATRTTARVHSHSDRRLDARIIFTLRGEEARVPIQDDTQGLSLCGNKLPPRPARLRADSRSRPAESQVPRALRQRSRRRAPQRLPAGRQDQRVSPCPRLPCSAERSPRSR